MDRVEKYNRNLYERLSKDSEIKDFINKHGLSEDYVIGHINLFNACYESLALCRDCDGLASCKQKRKGEVMSLAYDGTVYQELSYCDKKRKQMDDSRILSHFIYSDIPKEYEKLSLDNIPLPDDEIKKLFLLCFDILSGQRNKGLYILGDLGVGKTYMCMALANSLNLKGESTAFVKCTSFINNMRRLVVNDSASYDRTMAKIKECKYLILDDLGSESVSSFSRDDVLFDLLDYRMEHKLCTVFTTNLPKKDLYLHYVYDKNDNSSKMRAKRLIERIGVLSDEYVLSGNNKRLV